MQIIRSDNTKFTLVEITESISSNIKRGDLVEKAKYLSQTFDCKFGSAISNGSEIKLLFSKSAGYPLGEAAKEFLGNKEKYIWTEETPDGTGFMFVAVDKGIVVKETILDESGELDSFLLMNFLGDDNTVRIIHSGEIPEQLIVYLETNEIETVFDKRDYIILDKLQAGKAIECIDIEIAIGQIAFKKNKGINKISIAALVVFLGLVVVLVFDRSKESVALVFDPYVNYRAVMRNPSATAQLSEILDRMKVSEYSNRWNFSKCDVNSGPLVCELIPTLGSNTGDLERLLSGTSNAKYYLVGEIAHLVIPLSPSASRRPDLMVNMTEVLNTLYDRLNSDVEPDELKILESVNNNSWGTQNISIVKRDTGLYTIGLIAKATNGLPVNFVKTSITKKDFLYSIDVELQVVGSN